jgi:predicted component of type VI protein secretion system
LTVVCLFLVACGKKGPPLPPLVKVPVAPSNVTAVRRAETVDLQLTVPSANTDSSRPANVARVEVYALTGPATVSEADVLKQGTKVATIAVKAPRDPDATFDPDDPDQFEADVEPPEGAGLDQGTVAHVQEALTAPAAPATSATTAVRTYVGVGITTKGRRGPSSRRVAVPLVPSPPPPSKPEVTYTETAVTVKWESSAPKATYNVYEVAGGTQAQQLTKTAIAETQYTDTRLTWGATRCYAVRSVETVDALSVESEATPAVCVTLADTFPPAAPKGLQAVATEGIVNLIWDANTETDLDGYILLRATSPDDELAPITPSPIRETAFQDRVPAGVRYIYALKAVDKAGNASPASERIEETAR